MRLPPALLAAAVLFAPILAHAQVPAAPPPAPAKPQRFARLLARECDALIDSAVKRPYGWAWADADPDPTADQAKPTRRREYVPVSMEPSNSPAAALILLHAADLLHEPRYTEAARNVGRGIAATQQPRGNFPAVGHFGRTSGTTVGPASPLLDRAPTRAALALLLSLVDADPQVQDAVTRAAPRAAQWLMRQQAESAAWPTLYPPGASPQDAIRLVRLDTPDTRDSVFAMLLTYEVLGEVSFRRSAERSLDFLLKFRTGPTADVGAGLWRAAYIPSGLTVDKMPEFPPGSDALAARYTVQTFFVSWVVLGDGNRLAAAELSIKSLDELIKANDGKWRRFFPSKTADTPTTAPATPPVAPTPTEPAKDAPKEADQGWTPATQAVTLGRTLGREQYRDRLAATFSLKQRLALTLVGLSDAPMHLDFPTSPEEAAAFLKDHAPAFRQVEAGSPPELGAKVRRLWSLFLRARIEQTFGI